MMALALVGLASAAREGAAALLSFGAPVLLFGVLGWAAFWQPCVDLSDGGVTVRNTLRTVHVPWSALERVDGRYGLRLVTPAGAVTAWAAPAPAGRERSAERQSSTAELVRHRLEAVRASGHLDRFRSERDNVRRTWHVPLIAVMASLAVACLALPWSK
jgi:hypothetical protein